MFTMIEAVLLYPCRNVYTGHNFSCDQELFVFDCECSLMYHGLVCSCVVLTFYFVSILKMGPVPLGCIISSNRHGILVGGDTTRIVINCDTRSVRMRCYD